MKCLLLVIALYCAPWRTEGKKAEEDFDFEEDDTDKIDQSKDLVWALDPDNKLCTLLRCQSDSICLLQDRFTAVCVNKDEALQLGSRVVNAKDMNKYKKNDATSEKLLQPSHLSTETRMNDEADNRQHQRKEELLFDHEDDDDDDDDDSDDFLIEREKFKDKQETHIPMLDRQPFARKECTTCPVVSPVFLCGSDNRTYSSVCRLKYHNCLHDATVAVSCKGFCPCKYANTEAFKKEKERRRLSAFISKLSSTKKLGNSKTAASIDSQSYPKRMKENYTAAYDTPAKAHNRFSASNSGREKFSKYHSKKNKHGYKSSDKYWAKQQKKRKGKNEVLTNTIYDSKECSQDALEMMGNRMLDWFSVIMADSRRRPANPQPGPFWCKKEVSWMLGHLDQNNDKMLDTKELYRLKHDDREKCMKPFIDRCDMDRDSYLSGKEWCKCFDRSQRPCSALREVSKDLLGGYIPECDSEGYYRPTQCHMSAAMCWCVNKHGVEVPGSRASGNPPDCESISLSGYSAKAKHLDEDAENDEEPDSNYEGSADAMPLDI